MASPVVPKRGKGFLEAILIFLAVLLLSGWEGVRAEETPQGEVAGRHEATPHHRNHLSVFVGVTDDGDEEAFTLGAEYERIMSPRWGWGGLFDSATGELRDYIVGVPVFVHPTRRFTILAAPGFEYDDVHDESFFLFRVGFFYSFSIGKYTLAPAFNIDFVDGEEVYVYGVNFGRPW